MLWPLLCFFQCILYCKQYISTMSFLEINYHNWCILNIKCLYPFQHLVLFSHFTDEKVNQVNHLFKSQLTTRWWTRACNPQPSQHMLRSSPEFKKGRVVWRTEPRWPVAAWIPGIRYFFLTPLSHSYTGK